MRLMTSRLADEELNKARRKKDTFVPKDFFENTQNRIVL
jgi:hypothetical protein